MPKKTTKKKKSTTRKKKTTRAASGNDARAFLDHVETSREMARHLKKGWDKVIAAGKKKGFKFTRQDLRNHIRKRYGVSASTSGDDPNTCFCI